MGLNIGETDKVFYINICCFCRKTLPNLASLSHSAANTAPPCQISRGRYDQSNLIQYGLRRHVEFTSCLHFDTFSRLGRQNASAYQISCKSVNISQSYDVSYISYIVTFQLLQCFPASKVTITRHSHIQASEFSLMAALLKF